MRLGPATILIDNVQVLSDEVRVHIIAHGPLSLRAHAQTVIAVEAVHEHDALLHLSVESNHRTVRRLLGGLIPTLIPMLEGVLQRHGVAGVTIDGDQIAIEYEPFVQSILSDSKYPELSQQAAS